MNCRSWFLTIIAAALLIPSHWNTARAQTPVTFSFTGTGAGTIAAFSLGGAGTITPYGATTIAVTGGTANGSSAIAFVVTFGDGSTFTASGVPVLLAERLLGHRDDRVRNWKVCGSDRIFHLQCDDYRW